MSAGPPDDSTDRIRRIPSAPRPSPRRRWPTLVAIAVVVVVFAARRVAAFYTDALWFDSLGFSEVFWRSLAAKAAVAVVTGVLVSALLIANLLIARRLAPTYRMPVPEEAVVERYREALLPFARPLLWALGLGIGLLSGLSMVVHWETVLLWLNGVPFGRNDPHFERDLGWFVFSLPFQRLVSSWISTTLVITLALTAAAHYLFGGIRPQAPAGRVTPAANVHVSVLLAAIVAVRGWRFWLDQFLLSYSERGQVTGLSYTDINAELPAYRLLVFIAAVCVVLFLLNVRYRNYLLPAAGVSILVVAAVVLSGIYPAVIQRLQVDPQELERERPYIERNLAMTRFGYGLEDVERSRFPAEGNLTASEVTANAATLESVRLWDPATLQATYQQVQAFRPYYQFNDIDVDRYEVDGETRQVLLGVRELDAAQIPEQARTWQNQRLVYTHGYGYAASPASAATAQGQPLFVARDIPPEGDDALIVDNPRIYFGENSPTYSVVDTDVEELDFPLSDDSGSYQGTNYDGAGGVGVGSPLRRLAFTLRFGEPNLLLSGLINPDSKVLFNRRIKDRVANVAPYLKLDHDPYAVAVDGSIKWVLDAYTSTDMIPYSERVDLGELTRVDQRVFETLVNQNGETVIREGIASVPGIEGQSNYLRNSVKAVVDAYDGDVTLYAVEPEDPILQAWGAAFPGSFTSVDEATPELRAHFRYPEDLFRVQSSIYTTYHMENATEFYAKEDAWTIPRDAALLANLADRATEADRRKALRPYYLLLRLPDEAEEEFALIQPFIPTGEQRRNLIGYLAGRSDPDVYGQLRAFTFPSNRTVFGPEQVQARIDADGAVSEQITLWSQSGSTASRGNLLVLPIEDSLLYVQPLFLQADQTSIPELKKVVVVFGDTVVMEDTLAGALAVLFGETVGVAPPGDPAQPGSEDPAGQPPDPTADPRVGALIQEALEHFAAAEEALREGDLGRYQQETAAAQELLEQADRIARGLPPEPSGDAATEAPGPDPTDAPSPTEPAAPASEAAPADTAP